MSWFLDLPTRNKLLLCFGTVLLCLGAVIASAYSSIAELRGARQSILERDVALLTELLELRAYHNRARLQALELLLDSRADEQQAAERRVDEAAALVARSLARVQELASGDAVLKGRLDELAGILASFQQSRQEMIRLARAGKRAEARALGLGAQRARADQLRAIAVELDAVARQRMAQTVADSERGSAATVRLFTLLGGAALLFSLAMAYYLNRVIATPLRGLTDRAARIVAGDLMVRPAGGERRADEIGVLEARFDQMAASLQEKILVAEGMVGTLKNVNRELLDGVNVLAAAASEILASTNQVASSAEETASAISQTTATLEEVKQTAHLAVDKARHVSDAAQRTVDVSAVGRSSVDQSMAAMHGIQEQMEAIAGATVRLSEQSQAIGEIIATVNDLAEQSNLLAVNAAIEAAKSGEQGKGFAVVAQEIKSLAEQSKQATAQVRGILGDIQKATGSAVLATEQALRAVDAGVKLSAGSGEAIGRLAESIAEAAGAATQIAASAQQQLVGMDQAVLAIQNIREASAMNAASTRQAEGAARNLHELGQKLKTLAESSPV